VISRPNIAKTLEIPVQELIAGTVLAGRYQVSEELSRGGMGRLFLLFGTAVKEKIALKLLNSS